MKGQGSTVKPEIAEYTSNIEDQKAVKLEHDQNVWYKVAGACLHLLQIGSTPGNILDSLTLDI